MAEQTFDIREFRGLNDYGNPLNNPSFTRSLNAVTIRNNRIVGALGINKLRSISTVSATTPIIGLMPFYETDLDTTLYRMTATKLHQLNTATDAWDDVTGTDLTGSSTTLPQFCVHKDTLCFTNEGEDRPRKLTGSGNSAELGGTPPFAKGMCQGWGYLFLLNYSSAGSTFLPRNAIYSDDFDVNWDLCNGNELTFNETNGELITGITLGDLIVFFKSDSLFRVTFEGRPVRFKQPRLDFDAGLLAPLSPAICMGFGVPFLGTDYRMHYTDGHFVKTVPPYVQKKLDDTLLKSRARWAVGANYPDKDSYSLFYQASSSDSWNRNRITFNFRTGEFSHRIYTAHEFVRLGLFRYDRNSAYTLIGSTTNLVYELDSEEEGDDGTIINRFYDFDWMDLGFTGEKYLKGVTFEALRNANGRVAVSVASDMRPDFVYEKFYDLRGGKPTDEYVSVHYRIDPGLRGYRFKVRLRLFHDDGSEVEIIPPMRIQWEPESPDISQQSSRSPAANRME